LTVFPHNKGNNQVVSTKKEEVQSKPKRGAASKREADEGFIGIFLAWMFLYWVFVCILALSLSMSG